MLLIVGTVRVPPGTPSTARAAMAQMITASRAEPGCLEYSYAEDVLQPGLVHVSELWQDRAALVLHFTSDHMTVWRSTFKTLDITDRNLRLYEVGEPQPL